VSRTPSDGRHPSLGLALSAGAALTLGSGLALSPSAAASPAFWALVTVPALLLGAASAWGLHRAGRLAPLLRPRAGDLSLGALLGGALLLASFAGRSALLSKGLAAEAWLLGVYALLGDPAAVERSALLTLLLFVTVAAEELVLRGYVHEALERRLGARLGWLATAGVAALTLSPTLATLAVPGFGPNPVLVLTALLLGLALGLTRQLTGRITPGLVAHGVFTYFSLVQFRLPGL
jgi:membrane protease YdiL (CAAX protease family)